MLRLLRNANLFGPAPLGRQDLLIAGDAIAAIGRDLQLRVDGLAVEDLAGAMVTPGLIDAHVHVTGGGGESGPSTRVPPISVTALSTAGVTSCVGLLGTDGTTRTMRDLVGRTLGLREEGVSAWCYTGSYECPPKTLLGSVRDDIVFCDPVIGVGELAISDHRSSQPSLGELLRVAADAHVAGLMSGKAGVVHLHLGDGPRGLALVREALDGSELPPRVFHPTHVNRRRALLAEAVELARRGCSVDVTAFPPDEHDTEGVGAADAITQLRAAGVALSRITCSSDGGGCLPTFDADGRVCAMDVGRPSTLLDTLQELLRRGVEVADALAPFTSNVAALLRLGRKGRVEVGADADLLVFGDGGRLRQVIARGRDLVRDGAPVTPPLFVGAAPGRSG